MEKHGARPARTRNDEPLGKKRSMSNDVRPKEIEVTLPVLEILAVLDKHLVTFNIAHGTSYESWDDIPRRILRPNKLRLTFVRCDQERT